MLFRSLRHRALLVFAGALSLTIIGSGCEQTSAPVSAAKESAALSSGVREREAPRVRVAPLEQREMVQILETTTVIESESEVSLIPRSSGFVVELLCEEGDRVEAGAILARLDNRDAELAVQDAGVAVEEARTRRENNELAIEEAQAGIKNARFAEEQAQRDFDRNDRLHGGDSDLPSALSSQALEASRLELERSSHEVVKARLTLKRAESDAREAKIAISRAEVALKRAEITRDDKTIRAPISGVIASRSIRVGDTVGSEAAFVLTDMDNLRAVFYRPQRELSLFATGATRGNGDTGGLEIMGETEALPGARFRGYIERASPTINADSGSFRVTAKLSIKPEDQDGEDYSHLRLLPGMLIRLEIVTDRHPQALVVHKRAVRREGEESFVLKVNDNMAQRVLVTESFAEDEFIEIVPLEPGSLTPDDSIITVGARDLEDGAEVRIEDELDESQLIDEAEESDADSADEIGDESGDESSDDTSTESE